MSLFSKLSKNNDKTLYPWSQKKLGGSNSALPRAGHAATAVTADAFIIYGGIHRSNSKKELFSIDSNSLSANSIHATGDIPSQRISPVIVAMNGHVLLFGGKPYSADDNYDPSLYLLNLHSKQWTRIQMEGNHPMERSGHTAVAHEGVMYIWGGQNEGNYFNDLFVFNSSTFSSTPRWEQINYNSECPEPRSGHISAIYDNKLYIYGGTDGHRLFGDLWSFDLQNGLWTKIETEGFNPAARESCASAMVDDVIYIIGGKGEKGIELNDLCAYKIRSRRWFRFQNMGPSPSPRHGLTMTAVREKLYVLGGDNETAKLDDSSFIFILDSTKIKYPTDTPQPQPQQSQSQSQSQQLQSIDSTNNQQQYDTSSIEEMNNGQHQQYYQQQQQQQQYQQGAPVPQQQFQQQQQQQQRQQQARVNQPTPPQQSPQSQRPIKNSNMIDTSVNYSDNSQPSPTSSSSPSSLTSPRHRSYYPEPQNQNQPPVRPPRHMSTVPEAALRRPRATSPLPQNESEIAMDIRRQYQSPASSMENNSPLQASLLSATEDTFLEPPRMMSPPQSSRSSPVAPPPRPPREGVGLGNAQRGNAPPPDINHDHEDQRPKSHIPPRNHSNPHSPQLNTSYGDMSLAQQQAAQQHAQQLAEQQVQLHAQQQAHQIAEQKNALMAEQQAQQLAEHARQQLAEQQAHQMAEKQARQLAEQQARQLAEQQARQLAEQQARQLAEQQARQIAQQQAQQQALQHQQYPPEQIPERSPSRQLSLQQHSTANSPSPVNRPRQLDNTAATAAAVTAANAVAAEERQSLVREIKSRDLIITEMKKKENWWRTEVSLARKQRANKGESFDEGPDADEALLMDVDHLEEDKVKLFEQLVSVKSELRRVRGSILQQAQPMSEKVSQADRMRTAALQEAAYFKSKYLALKSRRQEDVENIEISRCDDLEKRLAAALIENEANSKMLQQLQKRSQHDQTARVSTEERAREAQERAEEAQQAHQRALEELQVVYARATKAEVQVRDNAVKIADLTQQLSDALLAQPVVKSQEVTEAQLKASQLEAANLKARNESAALKQKLAESMDDIARLRTLLTERDDALSEAKVHVEDYEIQLGMMREAMNQQQHQKNASVNGFSPTRAY